MAKDGKTRGIEHVALVGAGAGGHMAEAMVGLPGQLSGEPW